MKRILDPCCGSKMMWFDRNNPDVEFCDVRKVDNELIWASKDGSNKRYLTVDPDIICDVRQLPFADNTFYHIVFDPPHLQKIGDNAWMCKKYGKLGDDWQAFIHDSFVELMRVLKPNGTLIFKWSEIDIKVSDILKAIPYNPLYGHRSGKHMSTHWMAFIKDPSSEDTQKKKGYWYDKGSLSCRCSNCGCKSPEEFSFCPNCGADMRGRSNAL